MPVSVLIVATLVVIVIIWFLITHPHILFRLILLVVILVPVGGLALFIFVVATEPGHKALTRYSLWSQDLNANKASFEDLPKYMTASPQDLVRISPALKEKLEETKKIPTGKAVDVYGNPISSRSVTKPSPRGRP